MIATLPTVLKLEPQARRRSGMDWPTFRYAAEEVAAGRPGSETVLAKMSELSFVSRTALRGDATGGPDRMARWTA